MYKMEKQHKNYQDGNKKSAINKKINSQIKKPHLKMIPIKDNYKMDLTLNIDLTLNTMVNMP